MNILEEIQKGVDGLHLPDSEKAAALETIGSQLVERVGIAITETLSEEDLGAYTTAAEQDEIKAIEALDAKIPNFESIVQNELQQLIEEYQLLSE